MLAAVRPCAAHAASPAAMALVEAGSEAGGVLPGARGSACGWGCCGGHAGMGARLPAAFGGAAEFAWGTACTKHWSAHEISCKPEAGWCNGGKCTCEMAGGDGGFIAGFCLVVQGDCCD